MTVVPAARHLAAPARFVEVAIDLAGPGGDRLYTYQVPDSLAGLEPGEAVIVPFGRRQAIGIVLAGSDTPPAGVEARPVASRVRSDGPLLPPLTLALARWVSGHYLAPPSVALRAMLPPGLLERLELVVERVPPEVREGEPEEQRDGARRAGGPSEADAILLDQLAERPRAVGDLATAEGRAGVLRRLRALEARGLVHLDWTLTAAGARPRYARWLTITAAGRETAAALERGARPPGRPLGGRQREALAELAALPPEGTSAADLAARRGWATVAGLVRRGLATAETRILERRPLDRRSPGLRGARPPGAELTAEQAAAVGAIRTAIATRDPQPLLLDGVTGAGKTAVYSEAIVAALEVGRPALLLVPEIAAAAPLIDRLRADLDAQIAVIHSALSAGERADEWRRVRAAGADVVVGTRLAVGAPLADVGLVVVDEEHDPAYKSDRTPRLQARDAAIRLGELAGAAVVLGSATPAVETVGHARAGRFRRVALPSRVAGAPPAVEVVDLRAELAAGNRSTLSRRLVGALAALDTAAGERAILVINRRGAASVVLCRDCGHVQACGECGRPLVYHAPGATLRCHTCGTSTPLPGRCPACRSARIRYLGGGTQRVEREVRDRLPALRVGRLDRDVAERRGAAERVLDAFAAGALDVLVGTSLVAKGIDVPEVTLVAVVSADVALNLPDERAAERTYQLLAQAIGRAGRGDRPGRAIVQTYLPGHPVIRAIASGDAGTFYDAELELRRRFGSPPFGRLAKLTVGLADRAAATREAEELVARLRARAAERGSAVTVTGPAPAYVPRRAGRWRLNVVLRGTDPAALLDGGLPAPWSVDVDPESLL